MLSVLQETAAGAVRIGDVVERLADEFNLTAEDRSHLLPSDRQTTFANRVHWDKNYLGKAGLVELTRRAHFRVTDRGREVLKEAPERIDIRFLTRFPEFQTFHATQGDQAEAAEVSAGAATAERLAPDEVMRGAGLQLGAALASDLLQRVAAGDPPPLKWPALRYGFRARTRTDRWERSDTSPRMWSPSCGRRTC